MPSGLVSLPTGWYSNGMPRPRGPARDQLLEAAQRLLLERGYEAAALDEVCATAQVTKGGLFYHFESKEQLAAAAQHGGVSVDAGALADGLLAAIEGGLLLDRDKPANPAAVAAVTHFSHYLKLTLTQGAVR